MITLLMIKHAIVYSTLTLQMISKVDILVNIKTFGVRETSVKTTKIVVGTDATLWRSVHKEYNSELQYKTYIGFNNVSVVL